MKITASPLSLPSVVSIDLKIVKGTKQEQNQSVSIVAVLSMNPICITHHFFTHFFSRGHGTYVDEEKLTASVAGEVQRVDKLICVRPLKTR